MVCPRCIMAVQQILNDLEISISHIQLGLVVTEHDLSNKQTETFSNRLDEIGFELLNSTQQQTVEQIKKTIIENIQHSKSNQSIVFSELLSEKLNKDYSTLSKLFSTTEGITIEQYVILQKVERIKELLSYNQMTLSEIAFEMGYSSVAHISSQFKKITGMTPSQFKSQSHSLRKTIDSI